MNKICELFSLNNSDKDFAHGGKRIEFENGQKEG